VLTFIAAEPREFSGFLRHLSNLTSASLPVHWAREGNWKRQRVLLIANGAGPKQSLSAARACDGSTAIINTGFCGALDSDLNIGDVIVADKVFFSSQMFDCRSVITSANFRQGAIYSSARIAATAKEKEQLHRTGAIAVEMEAGGSGANARIAFRTNVDDFVEADADHPIFLKGEGIRTRPYVLVRDGLESLIARPVYYRLAEMSVPGPSGRAGVWSNGVFFELEAG